MPRTLEREPALPSGYKVRIATGMSCEHVSELWLGVRMLLHLPVSFATLPAVTLWDCRVAQYNYESLPVASSDVAALCRAVSKGAAALCA